MTGVVMSVFACEYSISIVDYVGFVHWYRRPQMHSKAL
jgi:hypothetical protein